MTIEDLIRRKLALQVQCNVCGHKVIIGYRRLPKFRGKMLVRHAAAHFQCTKCKFRRRGKNSVSTFATDAAEIIHQSVMIDHRPYSWKGFETREIFE